MAGSPWGVMAKMQNCGLEVSKPEFQFHYYIHFWTNTLVKGMNPLITPAMA